MILQTSILPIEFDYKTIIKAQQTKRLLDSNPQFLKHFYLQQIKLVLLIKTVIYI